MMIKQVISKSAVALVSGTIILAGCVKEQPSQQTSPEETIRFVAAVSAAEDLSGTGMTQTKSVSEFVREDGTETVFSLMEEVSDMPDPIGSESELSGNGQLTKADLIQTGDEFKDKYGSFWVSAYKDGSKYLDIEKLTVTKPTSGDTWTFSDKTMRYWTGSQLEFFAWSPAATTYDGGQAWSSDPTFTPGKGSTATATVSGYTLSDPTTQADLLLGYYYGSSSSSESGSVSMAFIHPLTAVTFEVDSEVQSDETLKDYKINYIEIKGVASTATCTATLNTSPAAFAWTVSSTADWKKTFAEGGIALSALQSTLDTLVFIPQTFGDGAKLCLNISGGNSETYTIYYNLKGKTWTAGKVQKYSITFKGTPAITVTDDMDGNIKKNLVIKNTGDCKAWIRAAIVGYWCKTGTDENTKAWISTTGTFDLPATTNWEQGADGFWYYKNPVPANTETPEKLFNSYACPTAPEADLYLKMFVMVQSVKYDADKVLVTKAWGNGTPITN